MRRAAVALAIAVALAGCGGGSEPAVEDHGRHGGSSSLTRLLETDGPRAALAQLRAESRTDPAVASACHHHGHELGVKAFALHGFPAAMRDRNDMCVAGYVHGLLEAFVGTADDVPAAMRISCAGADATSRPGDECFHGVGHGVMVATQQDRVRSLALCGTYVEVAAQAACSDGVWMAAFSPLAPESDLGGDGALRLCREQAARHKASCYRHGSWNVVASLEARAYGEGLRWCAAAEPGFALGCTSELGAQLAAAAGPDLTVAESVCEAAERSFVPACIAGVTTAHHPYFAATPEPGRGLCSRLQSAHRAPCQEQMDELDAYLCPAGQPGCVPEWQHQALAHH